MSFPSRLGFLSEVDAASFSLKWVPRLFKDRKCENFALAAEGGVPGGDGGISRFGTGGSVKSCIDARGGGNGETCPLTEALIVDCASS